MPISRSIQYLLLLPAFLCAATAAYPQTPAPLPGNVPGLTGWLLTRVDSQGAYYWEDRMQAHAAPTTLSTRQPGSINGNPALSFDGDLMEYTTGFNLENTPRFSCFAVCQSGNDSREQSIWSVENKEKASLVMTTGRMADLEDYRYMDLPPASGNYPGIYTYLQYKQPESGALEEQQLRIGHKPRSESLPLYNFQGLISEVLIYDRVLSLEERLRVESYLAIKYGLSLGQTTPVSYLNAQREAIWDGSANRDYPSRMTAIGRDSLSGLNQRSSESSFAPGLLKISVQNTALPLVDNSFLLCADNGARLKMVKKQGEPQTLSRHWKVQLHGSISQAPVRMDIASGYFETPLQEGHKYWMMIDRTGTGAFPLKGTVYLPAEATGASALGNGPSQSQAFENLRWDAGSNAQQVFTFIEAPAFFARVEMEGPACKDDSRPGKLNVALVGGKAPYRIRLLDENKQVLQEKEVNSGLYSLDGVAEGHCFVLARDASGLTCTEELYVSHADAPQISLADTYTLREGMRLQLSAGEETEGYRYRWEGPEGFSAYGAEATLSTPGAYLVSVENEAGCRSTCPLTVEGESNNNFRSVEVLPNPTKDGYFTLRIHLLRAAPVQVTLYDTQGVMHRQASLTGESLVYLHREQVTQPGMYLIKLESDGTVETRKLLYTSPSGAN